MKFKVTSSCLYNDGQHAEEGSVIEVTSREAAVLHQAGRGYPITAEEIAKLEAAAKVAAPAAKSGK